MGPLLQEPGQAEEAPLQSMVDAHHTKIDNCYISETTTVRLSWIARRLPTTKASTVAWPVTSTTPTSPSWLLLLLRTRKQQRRSNTAISQPRRRGRLLLPTTTMAGTGCTPSPPWPLPKALKSPWLSLWKVIEGTHQWTVPLCH